MLLSEKIINWNSAKNWFHKNQSRQRETSLQYQGEWLSFEIFTDGVKKISFNKLKESYDQLSSIDPRSLMLFHHLNLEDLENMKQTYPFQKT